MRGATWDSPSPTGRRATSPRVARRVPGRRQLLRRTRHHPPRQRGVVDKDWQDQAPNKSTPFGSVVALVVRKATQEHQDWDDLLKPGVRVVTPNPGSSGSAKWNLLAPFSAKSNGGRDVQAGLDYVSELIRNHATVVPNRAAKRPPHSSRARATC